MKMDQELAEILPLFLDESRLRLVRLGELLALLPADRRAEADARRELHTLKGSCRLLELAEMAELCQRGEELLQRGSAGLDGGLGEVLERFGTLLDAVADHGRVRTGPPEVG